VVLGSLVYPPLNHLLWLLTGENFIQINKLKSTVSHSKCNRVEVNSEIVFPNKSNMSSVLGLYNIGGYKKIFCSKSGNRRGP
jgi:hypothetical protein